jgi:pilus assembly protein FimV
LRTDPQRVAIHCKLLDIYAKRRDIKAFEVLAYEVYSLTQGLGPEWEGVCELGREISPENPLYQPGGMPTQTADGTSLGMQQTQPHMPAFSAQTTTRMDPIAPPMTSGSDVDLDLDFSLGDDYPPTEEPTISAPPIETPPRNGLSVDELSFTTTSADSSIPTLEFDDFAAPPPLPAVPPLAPGEKISAYRVNQIEPFSSTPPAPAAPPAAAPATEAFDFDIGGLEFSLDDRSSSPPPAAKAAPKSPPASPARNDLDMDMLEFDMGDLSHTPPMAAAGLPTGPGDLIQMEMIGSEAVSSEDADPLETKLSLAAEFLAIGDTDAARSLAEEVVEQATGALKKKASKFLSDMA